MRHTTLHFTCGLCGLGTGPVDNDVADSPDTMLPPGWVQVVARRVMPDPDYSPPKTPDQLADEIAGNLPDGTPPEQREQVSGLVALMAAVRPEEDAGPTMFVDEAELHVCNNCAPVGLFAIDPEGFEEAGWEDLTKAAEAAAQAQHAAPAWGQAPAVQQAPASAVTSQPEVTDETPAQDAPTPKDAGVGEKAKD